MNPASETISDALFGSAYEALIFAFNYADQQFARSPMGSLYSVPGSGRGLVGVYGAGEAGMIMAEVMRLQPLERDALCARFTKVRGQCPCCNQARDLPQVRDALTRLERYALQSAKTSNTNLVRALVRDYFGLTPMASVKLTAEQHNVHRNTVGNHAGKVKRSLRRLEQEAERHISAALQRAGKVFTAG